MVHDPGRARELFERYRDAFSEGYRASYSPLVAVNDIKVIEGLSAARPLSADFHRRTETIDGGIGLKVWSLRPPDPAVGARADPGEHGLPAWWTSRPTTSSRRRRSDPDVWLHDMVLERAGSGDVDLLDAKQRLEACFLVVMTGGAENDGYNALVLSARAGLARRRADPHHLALPAPDPRALFAGLHVGRRWRGMRQLAAQIVQLFHVRFDPRLGVDAGCAHRQARTRSSPRIEAGAGDGRRASTRTASCATSSTPCRRRCAPTYYQIDVEGRPKAQIAIKFASRKLEGLPLPKPLYEIFVYSPRVEGVHLRFGKVARGGIRWSDRPQDFRTEVLGLVKAQQVKNAVIVPVGAKGGFVPKQLPKGGTREQIQAEGTAAYKLFISTLLDVTDNLGDDGVVPPEQRRAA